jgi:hypothetical protein
MNSRFFTRNSLAVTLLYKYHNIEHLAITTLVYAERIFRTLVHLSSSPCNINIAVADPDSVTYWENVTENDWP